MNSTHHGFLGIANEYKMLISVGKYARLIDLRIIQKRIISNIDKYRDRLIDEYRQICKVDRSKTHPKKNNLKYR